MGYEKTERESPFEDGGMLWSKGYEIVCDKTGIVVRNGEADSSFPASEETSKRTIYRYRNSGRVKMPGGYTGTYDWGSSDDGFTYDRRS
jgi:hypothetical protein